MGSEQVTSIRADTSEPTPGEIPERQLLDMIDVAPAMMWAAAPDGARTWFSQSWLQFTGCRLEQALGDGWLLNIHPEDRERCQAASRRASDLREPFQTEYRLRHHSGSYHWVLGRGNPIRPDGAEFGGYVGACVEIDDRHRAEQALRFLADAGASLNNSLDYEETLERLPRLVVPQFADWCTVVDLEPGGSLRSLSCAHRDPAMLGLLEEMVAQFGAHNVDSDHIVARVIQSGEPTLFGKIDEEALEHLASGAGHLEMLHRLRPISSTCVPLTARGRTMGALVFVRVEGSRPYDAADLALAEELAGRSALAADNARLYSEGQRANGALQLLADAGTELASTLDYDAVLANLARLIVPRFADWCTIDILNDDDTYRRVVVAHKDPEMVEYARQLQERYRSADVDAAYTARLRAGETQWFPVIDDDLLVRSARDPEQLALLRSLGLTSAINAPLVAHGRAFGAISFILSESGRHYDDADVGVAKQLARRAGLFVENARLFAESQHVESNLLKANRALRFLADVGMRLGQSLDYEETVASVARLGVPTFADMSWVDVIGEDDRIVRAAIEHRDPGQRPRTLRLQGYGPTPGSEVARIMTQGFAQCFSEAPEELFVPPDAPPSVREDFAALEIASAIVVPLRARGRVFGALGFMLSGMSGRSYAQDDLALAEDIGNRAALFLDNARLYTEAQRTEAELRRANEAKDEFLSMMSHELRTPLTVINGGARILRARSHQLDEATRGAIINDIEGESERLFRMVENLLAMAHIDHGDELAVEPVLPNRLLERVIDGFTQRRPDRSVTLSVGEGVHALAAEPTYLEQVIRNLLSNADKYSPAGTAIEVKVESLDADWAAIRVLDRGVGIDPSEAELIFERFYRSERTAKLIGGSGVGLALCKRLVEAMSGQMWARPREGGGLEVGFTLPRYEEASS